MPAVAPVTRHVLPAIDVSGSAMHRPPLVPFPKAVFLGVRLCRRSWGRHTDQVLTAWRCLTGTGPGEGPRPPGEASCPPRAGDGSGYGMTVLLPVPPSSASLPPLP